MSTGTQALSGGVITGGSRSEGFFHRMLARIAAGQERKARAMVLEYLATQSDEHLTELGYSTAEIKSIRSKATGNGPGWP